jgi:aspartyl-tRNA(Asn)/glutamyl-tRNA(Gln) amidotransferase subunit A
MQNPRTVKDVHEAFESGRLTPVQFVESYLKRAESDSLNAFITVTRERALKQARAAEELIKRKGKVPSDRYPLLGIPLGIKDILTIEGVKTTCGSKMLENYVPPYSSTVARRLEEAGAVTIGKLNMDEFAMGGSNENSAFGPVKHPLKPEYVPGGSSGGSAAAVRAGLCFAALGSDTGGSVRLPASYCGVVGMKPTYGSVSRYGLIAFASSLDQVGPMANTVEDAKLLLRVMSGHDPMDSTSSPRSKEEYLSSADCEPDWKKLRIGVPKEYFVDGVQKEVAASVREALKWFESKGAKLVDISLPHTKYSVAVYYIVAVSEASSNLARFDGVRFGVRPKDAVEYEDLQTFYRSVRGRFGAEVKRRIILGTFALSSGYYDAYYRRACQVRRLIKNDFDDAFKVVDFIAAPVAPTTAYKLGEKVSDPLEMYLNDIFTIPVNLAGLPALSVPCGEDRSGLPIGLHLIAPQFGDGALLSLAGAYEKNGRSS